MSLTPDQRTVRELRRHLRDLTNVVSGVVGALDHEMKQPSSAVRGQRIAALTNTLQFANDSARHFGLGQSLKPRRKPATP